MPGGAGTRPALPTTTVQVSSPPVVGLPEAVIDNRRSNGESGDDARPTSAFASISPADSATGRCDAVVADMPVGGDTTTR